MSAPSALQPGQCLALPLRLGRWGAEPDASYHHGLGLEASRLSMLRSEISNTTNRGGLVVRARLDRRRYPTGKRVSVRELRSLRIERDDFHGDWNYVI